MKKTLAVLALALGPPTLAAPAELIKAKPGAAVPQSYIVVLNDGVAARPGAKAGGLTVAQVALDLATRHGASVSRVYQHAIQGFAARMSEARALALAADPRVAYVQENGIFTISAVQSPAPSWGLDRIDQRSLPLDDGYTHNFTGAGVHAYIIDTGIRGSHQEFAGRMGNGFSSVADDNGTNDCHGHGTHVAGTVGGSTYGVAKGVVLHPVRVLACNGSGTTEMVVAGVDWVTANHVKPAVANMSLGGGADQVLDDAVARSIDAGIVYGIAAGNSNRDACGDSPARVPAALTVGAMARNDLRSSFSNIGRCVDLFAPGSDIVSAGSASDTATRPLSGTSMATPHVVGVAALYLEEFGNQSPAAVNEALVGNATPGILIGIPDNSPNLLLNVQFGTPVPPAPPFPPPPPWVNRALHKRATGSAPCTPEQGPEKAVNGSVTGGTDDKWCSAAANRFLQVDLGGRFTITSFVLRHASAGGEPRPLNTRAFIIQAGDDGVRFSSVLSVPRSSDGVTYHFLSTPVTARHVRLLVDTPSSNRDPAARIYEFEVYGPELSPSRPPLPPPGPALTSFEAERGGPALLEASGEWCDAGRALTWHWDGLPPWRVPSPAGGV